jgi:peptidoglycan/LPS O-acetylase OafA/YrhL
MTTVERAVGSSDQERHPVAVPSLRGQRIVSLDGLRAIAVGLVIAYHFNLPGSKHGYVGVDVFFTLSGFLITGLFVEEFVSSGSIRVRGFLWRRVRRLWPEALMVVVFALAANRLLLSDADKSANFMGFATLFEFSNWWRMGPGHVSELLGQMWSLSVEEQFYLLWPFAVLFAVSRRGPWKGRRPVLAISIVSFVLLSASIVEGLLLRIDRVPNDRLYFGTDTRGAQLLIGAFFYCVLRTYPGQIRKLASSTVGWLALGGLLLLAYHYPQSGKALLDTIGSLLPQLITCLLLDQCILRRDGALSHLLSAKPLVAIGQLSYGLYIWHYPMLFIARQRMPGPNWFVLSASLVATFVAAWSSRELTTRLLARRRPVTVASPANEIAATHTT